MVQFALRWILMFDTITCAIPGAKRQFQAEENISAADLAPLSDTVMVQVQSVYERNIRERYITISGYEGWVDLTGL